MNPRRSHQVLGPTRHRSRYGWSAHVAVLVGLITVLPLHMCSRAGGEPLFAGALAFSMGAKYIATGDVNRDGKQDLIAVGQYGGSVLLGNGDGTFHVAGHLGSLFSYFVAIGDANADGRMDLVTANQNVNTISVFLGHGDGTFSMRTDYEVGGAANSVAFGDLNGDAKMDLVTANYGSTSVLLGNGDGTFQARSDYPGGGYSAALGDLNGDAALDIATNASILLGNGDGTFRSGTSYPTGQTAALGDLNHDGTLDIALANADSTLSVLLGDGNGTFQENRDYPTGVRGASVAIQDVSGDGTPDLITAGGNLSVLLGNGDGTFQTSVNYETHASSLSVAVGDVTGDGKPDLITENPGTDLEKVIIFVGNGDGSFLKGLDFSAGVDSRSVAIGDVSGDGKADIITANFDSGSASVLLGNGDGTFRTKVDYATGSNPNFVAVGDINRDGNPDLMVVNAGSNTVSLLFGNGDGTFNPRVDFEIDPSPWKGALEDVNGDGKLDIVTSSSFTNAVSVLLGNGDGTFRANVSYAGGSGTIAIGDVNQDARLDIVTIGAVLLGNGDGTFRAAILGDPSVGAHTLSIADVNGDGKPDLVLGGAESTPGVFVQIGIGDGTFQPPTYAGGTDGGSYAALGDFNGDGVRDVATANRLRDTMSVLVGKGDGTFQAELEYLTSTPRSIAIGDVNGDGAPDLVSAGYGGAVLLNLGSRATTLTASLDLVPHVINLSSRAPWVTAYVEPSGFDMSKIDLSTVRLAGSVPAASNFAVIGDHDADGIPDLALRFSRTTLDPLLTLGVNSLALTGSLVTGESFAGTGEIRVIDSHRKASVVPNPFNPSGLLAFRTLSPGRVTVTMYDVHGRLVRTLMEEKVLPAGEHEVEIDGRGRRGEALPSGVYFYNVQSPDGSATGRFAILK